MIPSIIKVTKKNKAYKKPLTKKKISNRYDKIIEKLLSKINSRKKIKTSSKDKLVPLVTIQLAKNSCRKNKI